MAARHVFSTVRALSVILILIGIFCLGGEPQALASPGGILNPGFEDGILDGPPNDWTVLATDAAIVVDSEGPDEFST